MSEWIDGATVVEFRTYAEYTERKKQLWLQHKHDGDVYAWRGENFIPKDHWCKVEPLPEPYVPPVPETVLGWNNRKARLGQWDIDFSVSDLHIHERDTLVITPGQAEVDLRSLAMTLNKAFGLGWVRHEYPAEKPKSGTYLVQTSLGYYHVDIYRESYGRFDGDSSVDKPVAWYELPGQLK